jgi:hypothetical protein
MGEGDPTVRDLFRVSSTTVPDLPLGDAGWEDDEDHPRDAAELVEGLSVTWSVIEDCLRRWNAEDLAVRFTRHRPSGDRTVTRGGVVWHVLEHDVHHGGEISQILGSHDLPPLDFRLSICSSPCVAGASLPQRVREVPKDAGPMTRASIPRRIHDDGRSPEGGENDEDRVRTRVEVRQRSQGRRGVP